MRQDGASTQNTVEVKAPHEAILDLPQERITGDILRGRGPRRGNLETLIKYWRPIMRKPGGFRRCLVILADHPELYPLERICAWLHHETTGMWPNEGNHHAGGKLGKIRRVVKKPRRRRRGKSFEMEAGIDVPIARVERRLERKANSVIFSPLDGTPEQIDYKSSKATRIVKAVESVLLPGEHGALKPRHLLATSLTPGGSGLPGPKLGLKPSRALRAGAGNTRGFRCPPGFERGGHFTDSRFSTCGRQLFGIPGSNRTALRTVSAAASRNTQPREKVGLVYAEYKAAGKPAEGVGGGMPALPDTVGPANPAKQASMVSKVLKSMSSVSDKTDAPIRRLVREDGSILQPLAPLNIIGKQKNNSDLHNASLLTRITEPGAFGADELALMQTGLKSVEFSLPGGGSVSLKRNGGLMSPGKARAFGKAIAAARRAGGADSDYAAILRETAAKTNAVTYSVNIPGEANPGRLVRTSGGKHVPYWVHKTFLTEGAPGKAKGTPAVAVEKAVGKSLKASAVKRLGEETLRTWGPLQYTAVLIPDYDEIDRTVGVAYKASAYASYRNDISWAFVEEKRSSSVWDRGINRFRCPPGTPDAGQITNRMGLGCAKAVAARMLAAFRNTSRDVGEATQRANRARRGDVLQRRQRKPAKRFRNATHVAGRIDIDRGLADRIEDALRGRPESQGIGVLDVPETGGRRGLIERLEFRIGAALDVPVDDAESIALGRNDSRGRIERLEGRIADALADDSGVGGVSRPGRIERLEGRIADALADDSGAGNVSRPGLIERLEERIARVFNPVHVRDQRNEINIPTNQKFDPSPEMAGWNRSAAKAQHDLMEASWRRRLDKKNFNDQVMLNEPRDWLEKNGPDLEPAEFTRLESEVLDLEVFKGALDVPKEDIAGALARLSPEVYGRVQQDALGRRAKFEADEALKLSQERRNRANLGINFPDGFSVDEDALNKIDHYRGININRRIDKHQADIDRKIDRVKEGKLNKIGVDRLIAELVTQRDKYRAEVVKNEGNYPSSRAAETFIGNAALAEMYDRALPDFVDEARRFERLDALKKDKDNGLGVLVFNDAAELGNVPLGQMPNVNGDEYDNFVIGIGNADDIGELRSIADEMNEAVREADEAVKGFDIMLKDQNLTDKQIADFAKARGEAAWKGEAAKRALKGVGTRRREIGGGGDIVGPNSKREDGNIGAYDVNGVPMFVTVPIGANGLKTQDAATKHLHDGGNISEVPDMFLATAIRGNSDRFVIDKKREDRHINDVIMYRDKKTDRRIFIKAASGGSHESPAEIMSNQIAAQLGFPVGSMRLAGPVEQKGGQFGGPAVPIVFENADVLFDVDPRLVKGERDNGNGLTDPKTFARGLLLDYITRNSDRHGGNWFRGNNPDGDGVFIPLDHGLAMDGLMRGPIAEADWVEDPHKWHGGRMQWPSMTRKNVNGGFFTVDDLVAEVEDALVGIETSDIDGMVVSIADALPSGYDNVNKGIDWQTQFPGITTGRIEVLKNMTHSELVEWISGMVNR